MKYRARVVSHSLLFPKIGLAVMAFGFSIRMDGYYQNDARANKTRDSAIRSGRRGGHTENQIHLKRYSTSQIHVIQPIRQIAPTPIAPNPDKSYRDVVFCGPNHSVD
jgi:hypothetical protein